MNNEVYFCGHCNRQQKVEDGTKCKECNSTTVTWDTKKETAEDAMRKWKRINGKS